MRSKMLPIAAIVAAIVAANLVFAATSFAAPQSEDDKGIVSFVLENDLFADTDRDYTNGVRFAWLSSESNPPEWVKWASDRILFFAPEGKQRLSVALGQNMYTPRDLTVSTPLVNDRPYAGWTYGSLGVVSDTGHTLDNLVLTLGVVGPLSHAEQTQKFVHRVIDSTRPLGWDNQLKNEPGIILSYERKWRSLYEYTPFGAGMDITPHIGGNVGNIHTDASIGTMFRLGYDLPADYGPPRIHPSLPGSDFFIPTKRLGGYFFGGVEGRAVARNIFLDGNTFRDSPGVNKKPLVGSAQVGAALTYGSVRLSYTHVFMTKEFSEQQSAEQFGALTLSYRF